MRPAMTSGSVGREDGDGWVDWQLVDEAFSYNPSLACGTFALVLGKGTLWSAPSNDHGQIAVVDFELTDSDPEGAEIGHIDFVWCLDSFIHAVTKAVEMYDHPAPHHVIDAARELWHAVMFDEVA